MLYAGSSATELGVASIHELVQLLRLQCRSLARPRERIHRPQTRRRRETNEDAMDKLKLIEANLKKSLDLCEWVLRRERKKRDLAVRLHPSF